MADQSSDVVESLKPNTLSFLDLAHIHTSTCVPGTRARACTYAQIRKLIACTLMIQLTEPDHDQEKQCHDQAHETMINRRRRHVCIDHWLYMCACMCVVCVDLQLYDTIVRI